MTDLVKYRYMELTDNLEEVGRLLYHTDPHIYPALFGNIENAAMVMKEAIKREIYCFSPKNIYCAFCVDKPIAIICKNPNGRFKWHYKEWEKIFGLAGVKIPCTFDNVAQNYFLPMNKECMEGVYILALCVSPELRGKRVGTELLRRFISIHSQDKILLDTLEQNMAGITLYKKAGFLEQERYLGYSLFEPYPRCVRMSKEII